MHPIHDDLTLRVQREVLLINPRVMHLVFRLVAMRITFYPKRRRLGNSSNSF